MTTDYLGARLYKDGMIVTVFEKDLSFARSIIIPAPEKSKTASVTDLRSRLPVHVLRDKYNPDYDEYFPLVRKEQHVFVLAGKEQTDDGVWLRYDYERTDSVEVRDRDMR